MSRLVKGLLTLPSFGTLGGAAGPFPLPIKTAHPPFLYGTGDTTDQPKIGGISGSTSTLTTPDYPGRTTTTPGTPIPSGSTPTTRAPFFINMLDTVWFDGHSALFDLPKAASDGTNFTMSFWYNPFNDDTDVREGPGDSGVVYGSPTTHVDLSVTPADGGPVFFDAAPTSELYFDTPAFQSQVAVASTLFKEASFSGVGTEFPLDPIDDMQGWCHVMMSIQYNSGAPHLTMWINETEICSDRTLNALTTSFPFTSSDYTDSDGDKHAWNIGGKVDRLGGGSHDVYAIPGLQAGQVIGPGTFSWSNYASGTSDVFVNNTTITNTLLGLGYKSVGDKDSHSTFGAIPGTYDVGCLGHPPLLTGVNSNLLIRTDDCIGTSSDSWTFFVKNRKSDTKSYVPSDGKGFIGAINELWIAPGQFIDWSIQANRQKFHTGDVEGDHFAPVDLGPAGKTPTGVKPLIYCTGPPQEFRLNRARGGAKLSVYRNSGGGFVGELLDYLKAPI